MVIAAWSLDRKEVGGSPGGCCRALLGLWGTERCYLAASEKKENRVLRDLIPFCNQ